VIKMSQYNVTPSLINALIDARLGISGPVTVLTDTSNIKDAVTYIATSADTDLSAVTTNHTVLINVAMTAGHDILLPQATTSNGGMHVRVIIGIPQTAAFAIGPAGGSLLVGAATFIGDATPGTTTATPALVQSLVATANKSVALDGDAAAKGGDAGTILDFLYSGVADRIAFSGSVTADVDTPTGASFFSTAQVAMT
jgi:hypothetical protein